MSRTRANHQVSTAEKHLVLLPSVWLVFLVFPLMAVFHTPASPFLKGAAILGIALFALIYVMSWVRPILLPRFSRLTNTLLWAALALITLIPLGLSAPAATAFTAPFFIAMFSFRLPLRLGLLTGVGVALLTLIPTLLTVHDTQDLWLLLAVLLPGFLIITVSRYTMDRSEATHRLRHELQLAHQRESVGRDVHDILGHSLTVISVKTQLARRLLDTDPNRAHKELDEILDLTRESLAAVRTTVSELRAPELSVQLLQCRSALRAAGITAHIPSGVPELQPEHRAAFAWILREAVTNVIRHSGAATCTVSVTHTSLTVVDDGVGFSTRPRHGDTALAHATSASFMGGNGLRGMRERAQRAGLNVQVSSPAPGLKRGTRVMVEAT